MIELLKNSFVLIGLFSKNEQTVFVKQAIFVQKLVTTLTL